MILVHKTQERKRICKYFFLVGVDTGGEWELCEWDAGSLSQTCKVSVESPMLQFSLSRKRGNQCKNEAKDKRSEKSSQGSWDGVPGKGLDPLEEGNRGFPGTIHWENGIKEGIPKAWPGWGLFQENLGLNAAKLRVGKSKKLGLEKLPSWGINPRNLEHLRS